MLFIDSVLREGQRSIGRPGIRKLSESSISGRALFGWTAAIGRLPPDGIGPVLTHCKCQPFAITGPYGMRPVTLPCQLLDLRLAVEVIDPNVTLTVDVRCFNRDASAVRREAGTTVRFRRKRQGHFRASSEIHPCKNGIVRRSEPGPRYVNERAGIGDSILSRIDSKIMDDRHRVTHRGLSPRVKSNGE